MAKNSSRTVGRHFLHIPGPSPLPDRVLRAMDTPIIDHRGPEFARLAKKCLEGIKTIFKTSNPVTFTPLRAPVPGKPRSSIRSRPATRC